MPLFELVNEVVGFEPIRALREYQVESRKAVHAAFKEFRRVLVVMATGVGKTIVFVEITKDYKQVGKRVLILAHSDELIEQARDKLREAGMESAKEKASDHCLTTDKVVVGSVQTLRGPRLLSFRKTHFDLVIVDEAHHTPAASYTNILDHFESAKVLGVTATPNRGDRKSLSKHYDTLAFQYGLPEAVKDGWLVRPLVKTMPLEIDLRKVKTVRGDLDSKEVANRIEPFLEEIAKEIWEEARGRKVLIFLPSIATSKMLAGYLRDVGFRAEFVSGECKDRHEKMAAYRKGKYNCLCNAMLLTEGYDDDTVDVIVCLRATKIAGLYQQIVGRGTRPAAKIVPYLNDALSDKHRRDLIAASTKPHLMILDFLWLYEKHDLITPAHLVAPSDEVARLMTRDGDLLELEAEAEKDLFESLRKALAEANKLKRTKKLIDPLEVAVNLHDERLANYEPTARSKEITEKQRKRLRIIGITLEQVSDREHASLIIGKFLGRQKRGLCTFRQINFLTKHCGQMELNFDLLKIKDATALIDTKMSEWRSK